MSAAVCTDVRRTVTEISQITVMVNLMQVRQPPDSSRPSRLLDSAMFVIWLALWQRAILTELSALSEH